MISSSGFHMHTHVHIYHLRIDTFIIVVVIVTIIVIIIDIWPYRNRENRVYTAQCEPGANSWCSINDY